MIQTQKSVSQNTNTPARKLLSPSRRPLFLACICLFVVTIAASQAQAQLYWDTNGAIAGSGNAGGNWDGVTSNWSSNSAGTVATGTWVNGNQARFSAGTDGVGSLNINVSGAVSPHGIVVEEGTVNLSSNFAINSTNQLFVQRGAGPTRLQLQGNGTTTTTNRVGVGNPLNIGGQTGTATLGIQGNHVLQVNGYFLLGERPGHAGRMDQTGGTVNVTNHVRVGHWRNETSTYDMSAGALNSTGGMYVGWDGRGIMNLSGSADVNANGVYVQRNSTINIGGSATLDATFLSIGDQRGTGTVVQDNGTVTVAGSMRVGHWPNSGSYTMNNGSLSVVGGGVTAESAGVITIGVDGVGTFLHNNGTIATQGLYLDARGASGGIDQYNMKGGTLILNSGLGIAGNANTSTFAVNLGGGTIQANTNTNISVPATLTGTNGSVTFNTNGNNIAVTGTLSGPGGFDKVGDGTLTLTGTGSSIGAIRVQRGTGGGDDSIVTFAGNGSTTATFLGVGNPLNVGGLAGTATVNVQDNHALQVNGNLFLGERHGSPGKLNQSGGSVGVTGQIRVGHWPNETSTYDMTAGVLNSNGGLYVGWDGRGIMNVTGTADANVSGTTHVQRNSTLTIGGNATFDTNFLSIGDQRGVGHVVQTGGTAPIGEVRVGHWAAGANSTYDATGGQLITNTLSVGWDGGNASMNIAGTANVDVNGTTRVQRNSTLSIGGNATYDTNFLSVGDQRGTGTVNQTGGTASVVGEARIGHWPNSGNYNINNGSLNVGNTITVGWDGVGLLDVSGTAVVNTGDLTIGRNNLGTVNQTGGTINVTNPATYNVGGGNTAIVNHSGGTTNVTGAMNVGTNPGAGTYNLTGTAALDFLDTAPNTQVPSANLSTLTVGANGTFNFDGGVLRNVTDIVANTFTQNGGEFVIGVDGVDSNHPDTTRAITTITGDYVQNGGSLLIDIFGPGSHGIGGEAGGTLAIDPLGPDLDSDLLHVTGDAFLDGILEIDLNEIELKPFAFYDVLLADGLIDADDMTLEGVNLYRVIDNPFGPGRLLQVAVPEPTSIAIWCMLGLGLGVFQMRRRATRR